MASMDKRHQYKQPHSFDFRDDRFFPVERSPEAQANKGVTVEITLRKNSTRKTHRR